MANVRYTLGMNAKSVIVEFFDIAGLCVFSKKIDGANKGRNQLDHLDISRLGSDVYTVRLRVKFDSGKKKQKFYRVGVIR